MIHDKENNLIFEKYIEILIESSKLSDISPHNIYNFYFLYTLSQIDLDFNNMKKFIYEENSKKFKDIWINAFKKVLYNQLIKYKSKNRIDQDFPDRLKPIDQYSCENLYYLMDKTYRTDMSRKNDRWLMLADYLRQLSSEETPREIYFIIDRINNMVHNTGTIMLDKFQNSEELIDAFNQSHNFKSLRDFSPHIGREFRKLLH